MSCQNGCFDVKAGRSTLTLVRRLAELRSRTPVLQVGTQRTLEAGRHVLAWLREGDAERWLAAMNFAITAARLSLPADLPQQMTLVMATEPDRVDGQVDLDALTLRPGEAVLLRQ
jgi:alpha-glucosidase